MLDILIDIMREKHCAFFFDPAVFRNCFRMLQKIVTKRKMSF